MGYECPVCDAEEADGEHLANHLAFTALVRGGDHEAFLDEHVSDWESRDPESLAPDVTPHAAETDAEPVTEPRGRETHGHGHDHEMPAVERAGQADPSGEAAAILDDAVELTEAMRASRVADPDGDDADGDDAGDAADRGSDNPVDDPADESDGKRDGANSENE
jgi:hypothetical protein